jgi:hypothetical protein
MNHEHDCDRLSAAEREQLAQQLLELHFGCHENPEHLEARLANEPALRELQAEVLQQARVLERAVRPHQPPLQLRTPKSAPAPTRWRFLRSPIARLASVAAVAAAAMLGFFVAERVAASRARTTAHERLHVTASAPRAVPAGAPWSVTVQTRDLTGAAVDCKVQWEALLANGSPLAASEVGTQRGVATIAMAADKQLRAPDRIVITATTATDTVKQVLPLSTAEAGPLVHVTTDRPVYQPGEPVFVRAVVLDRVTRLPLAQQAQPIVAQLLDAKGAPIGNDQAPGTAGGVASFVLLVPADSAGGPHQVRIASANGEFPPETAAIVVRSFQPPQLEKRIVLDRMSYAPGARGSAAVTAQRLAAGGGGATGASARGALVIDGTEVWSEQRVLGALGEVTFAFTIPKDVDKGAARFVATIDDGGIVETEVRPFVVPTGKVRVEAFPEGGELVAGVENALYLELTDSLGRPIDEAGEVIDERGRHVETFRTQHQGRVKFALVPKKGSEYRVRVAGQKEPFALPAVKENGIALRLLGDDVGASEPLRLALAGRGDGPWLLGVFCRGVLVGQTTLRADERGELHERAEVSLPPTATGVLRATVFDRNLQPIAERLVRRLAAQRLDVALTAQNAKLNPGDSQQITVRTTDETGAPQSAVVGIGVSDLAALSLGREPPAGLVDDAMLFADVERGENLGDFFLGAKDSAQHVDLLLGTRGWRRFVWRNDAAAQAAIAARGPAAEGTLAREGFAQTPQVVSNLEAARAAMDALPRHAERAERRLVDAATFAGIVMLLAMLAEFVAWVFRRVTEVTPWVQVVLGVGTAFTVFVVISVQQFRASVETARELVSMSRRDFTPSYRDVAVLRAKAIDGATRYADLSYPYWGYRALATNAWALDTTNLMFDEFDRSKLFLGAAEYRPHGVSGGLGDPAANPLAGAFYSDGGDGDIRTRTENFFQSSTSLRLLDSGGFMLRPGEWTKLAYLQQWRERQYAHQHAPSDDRRDFASTIFWNTLVPTDANGNATVAFATSDAVTTWRVHADAHTATGTGRLGQSTLDFTTQQPLHVEAKLPDEVSAGDQLQIPVSAITTDPAATEVAITAKLGDGLRLVEGASLRIELRDGRGRALLPIAVDNIVGAATIDLEARAGRFTDRVQHRIAIAPRGFPHRRSLGGSVEAGAPSTGTIAIPQESVPGSGHVTLKVYPSPISALTEGLAGILQEPHGCFEQASSSNYPNTLVLNLLEANGDNIPVVAARARELLPRGYAKITGYECKQKGYEWFGADPGHEALTAYGLLQFHDMAKVYDVDAAMVDRTRAWLLARRDGKGNFVHQGHDIHSFGGHSQVLTNAYVVYALLQAGTPAADLKTELDALAARSTTNDPYELALITCAFDLAKRPETASLRQRLAELQKSDGSLHGTTTSITCSGGRDLDVESTGFAILAWLPDPAFAANVHNAIGFVQASRSAQGTFGATQATIVALRALTAYATASRTMRTDGTLRIFDGDRQLAERAFTATETNALTFELWNELPAGEHTLRFEVEGGGGPLPWACDVSYHAEQPADDPAAAIAIAAALRAKRAVEGETVALDVAVSNTTDQEQPTPIALVGLPANCELPTRVLEDLQKAGAFAAWELRGRELVLYWRTLAPRAQQKLTLDLVARIPGACAGPASRAYLYYTPSQKRWAAELALDVQPH